MKRLKLYETGTCVFLACFLRACCINGDRTPKNIETEYFSTSYDDETISVVRSRKLISFNPVQWENPVPSDEGIWENPHWVSMSNMYAIVVIDSKAAQWVFDIGCAECPYFRKDMDTIGGVYVYNANDDTLKSGEDSANCAVSNENDRGCVVAEAINIEELFNRHKLCPCIFFGNGKNGVLFWRGDVDYFVRRYFITLLWAGTPVERYTIKKFKKWDDFLKWDGVLQIKDGN